MEGALWASLNRAEREKSVDTWEALPWERTKASRDRGTTMTTEGVPNWVQGHAASSL